MGRNQDGRIRKIFSGFNLLFVLTGIVSIVVGAIALIALQDFSNFLSDKFYSIPTFLIVFGSIGFFIGFIGVCGSFQQNYCMIVTYVVLMVVFFIFEISGGIAAYVLRDDISFILKSDMTQSIRNYVAKNRDAQNFWDFVQVEFNCCGATDYNDWIAVIEGGYNLPLSCCDTSGKLGYAECTTETKDILRTKGCVDNFGDFLAYHAANIGAAMVFVGLLQLAVLCCGIAVARSLKRNRSY